MLQIIISGSMFGKSVLGISEMDRQDLNPRFSVEYGLRFREPPWFNKTRFGPRFGPTRTGVVMGEDCLASSIFNLPQPQVSSMITAVPEIIPAVGRS